MESAIALIISLLLVAAAASTGIRYRPDSWYEQLLKPNWNPPNWLFPVAWSILYIMMAVAAWRVVLAEPAALKWLALFLYLLQLGFNAAWSYLFFGRKNIRLAFIDLSLLWVSLVLTVFLFMQVDPIAGWMLLPYLLWATFAGALNGRILQLNPDGAAQTN